MHSWLLYFCYAVLVSDPWPKPFLLVPQKSNIYMNCTVKSTSLFFWSINLANDSLSVQFQFGTGRSVLNAHGVYELPQSEISEETTILRLLINDTARNNGTVIHCTRTVSDSIATTLFVLGKSTSNCRSC